MCILFRGEGLNSTFAADYKYLKSLKGTCYSSIACVMCFAYKWHKVRTQHKLSTG